MLRSTCKKYILHFAVPGGTSRGVLYDKPSWIIAIWDDENPTVIGYGEVSIIPGLSPDDLNLIEQKISQTIDQIETIDLTNEHYWSGFPAVRFGFETAMNDLKTGGNQELFPSAFTRGLSGIEINGLVWMGDWQIMQKRIYQKVAEGFRCIKLKIGAIDFQKELELIALINNEFPELEIRLDANGAFHVDEALQKLETISRFKVHSIEQPIKPGQWTKMAKLCRESPVAIALDEELIGLEDETTQKDMLDTIKPQYIILKPSLVGGLRASEQWIQRAKDLHIKWWATSALESNIGLNAIAQWTFHQQVTLPQGLGTGKVFTNNMASPLQVVNGQLWYNLNHAWNFAVV